MIATGITEDGGREVPGVMVGDSKTELFQTDEWIAFPRRYLPEGSMDQPHPAQLAASAPALPDSSIPTAG